MKKKSYSNTLQYLSSSSITNSEETDDEWSSSFLKTLNHKKGQNVYSKMTNTTWWGWFLIIFTWFLFVTGMSGVFGIWQWVFRIEVVYSCYFINKTKNIKYYRILEIKKNRMISQLLIIIFYLLF